MRFTDLSLLVVFILVSVTNAQPDPFARGTKNIKDLLIRTVCSYFKKITFLIQVFIAMMKRNLKKRIFLTMKNLRAIMEIKCNPIKVKEL